MNPAGDKVKVIHVITRFDKGGSAENTFLTLRDLDPARYDLLLVAGADAQRPPADPEAVAITANLSALRGRGVRVIDLPRLRRDPSPFSDLAAFFSLLHLIRHERPHIVHTHTSKAGILGRWAAWLARIPVIVHTPHGHIFWGYFGPWKTRIFIALERWTARITSTLVMLTEREKADHLRFCIAPNEKFTVIHSGVDLGRFTDVAGDPSLLRTELNLPGDAFVAGALGRLTPIKGHRYLLEAAALLLAGRPDIYFVLAGEGELHGALARQAADLGISDHVRFTGWRADTPALLSVFDVLAFPSLNEGMGKAVVEAMAAGKPVVASNAGGLPDLIAAGENGFLVPPADGKALAEAIATLYENPETRKSMGDRGRERAIGYGIEAMIRKIDRLYGALIGPATEQSEKNKAAPAPDGEK
jgi:glycosyltransferase involved in cell wall biosynthesis